MSTRAMRFSSVKVHLVLPLISAAMLLLAFPFPGWGWLAFVALAPMTMLALRSDKWKRLTFSLWLVGVIWWMVILRWMTPVSGGGHIFLGVYLALYWPAAMLLVRFFHRRYQAPCVFTLPLVWVSLEWLRGVIVAGGFSWFALAHTQAAFSDDHLLWHSRIIQIADLFGEQGVSFLIAMANGLIVDLLTRPWITPATASRRRRVNHALKIGTACWFVCMAGSWGYGQWRIAQFDRVTSPGPVIGIVQTNVPQNNKMSSDLEQLEMDFLHVISMTKKVARVAPKPDLILWPESTPHFPLDGDTVAFSRERNGSWHLCHELISALAADLQTPILVGAYARLDWQPAGDTFDAQRKYNSAYLYDAEGRQAEQRYDKIHLVPVGEYLPWLEAAPALKQWFFDYLSPYEHDYTIDAGEQMTVFTIDYEQPDAYDPDNATTSLRFVTPICFEDTISRLCRKLVYASDGHKRADAMMNLTNDGWFNGSHQPWQHLQVATFRCIENRVPMVRSVNTGVSGYVDSLGRISRIVRDESGVAQGGEGTASERIRIDSRETLFGRIGHVPIYAMVSVTAILFVMGLFRRDRVKSSE